MARFQRETCEHPLTSRQEETTVFIKLKEILPFAVTCMELEDIMVSEISQRNTKIMTSLI